MTSPKGLKNLPPELLSRISKPLSKKNKSKFALTNKRTAQAVKTALLVNLVKSIQQLNRTRYKNHRLPRNAAQRVKRNNKSSVKNKRNAQSMMNYQNKKMMIPLESYIVMNNVKKRGRKRART